MKDERGAEGEAMSEIKAKERPVPLPEKTPFTFRARARSFVYAFRGIKVLLLREHNAWLHLAAAAAAGAAGWFFEISRAEWCVVAFAVGSVLAAEAFNTAIETLADAVAPQHDPAVGKAKDLAAGGVLLASLAAAAAGLAIFGPRLIQWLEHARPQR